MNLPREEKSMKFPRATGFSGPLLLVAILAMAGCGPETGTTTLGAATLPARGDAPIDATPALQQVPGVDMSRLNAAQQAQAVQIMQDNGCGCGCGMTVFTCRHNDPNCGKSPVLANNIVRLLTEGKTSAEVVTAVFQPAAAKPAAQPAAGAKQNLVFPVSAGDGFYTGPANAPVTLITWLDYQ